MGPSIGVGRGGGCAVWSGFGDGGGLGSGVAMFSGGLGRGGGVSTGAVWIVGSMS